MNEPDAQQLLLRLVMAWDADQDEEFSDLLDEARARLGLKLAADDSDEAGR